jgi:hypothetical protein
VLPQGLYLIPTVPSADQPFLLALIRIAQALLNYQLVEARIIHTRAGVVFTVSLSFASLLRSRVQKQMAWLGSLNEGFRYRLESGL